MKHLRILGTRGVPASHGGFETFAEQLALYLLTRGWKVTVYCQESGEGPLVEDDWRGVQRVKIRVGRESPRATIVFDWQATVHAARSPGVCLTLGYNTAIFSAILRVARLPNVINMDGIEWRRAKWGPVARAWLWMNEHIGIRLGTHLIADHPDIALHLRRAVRGDRITMIPYGADRLQGLPLAPVLALGLEPGRYLTLIARPEPENSVLEVVRGYSQQRRGHVLAVLGTYHEENAYHRDVRAAASDEVRFLGAIYDKPVVQALRQHCFAYVHGHSVGGTNPSLVEALGAGNAVFAHDNRFNRWVAGDAARYFTGADDFASQLTNALNDIPMLTEMRSAALEKFHTNFTWTTVLQNYEQLLLRFAA